MNVAVLIGIRTGKVGEANKAPSVTWHSIGMKFSPYKQCLLFLLPPTPIEQVPTHISFLIV